MIRSGVGIGGRQISLRKKFRTLCSCGMKWACLAMAGSAARRLCSALLIGSLTDDAELVFPGFDRRKRCHSPARVVDLP